MLQLDREALIGRGLHRECYQHPDEANLCVKIVVAGNSDENRREAHYYARLSRRGISWDMLARFHGLVATSLGEGAVFDLVRDFDGQVSRTLASYLESPECAMQHGPALADALRDLRAYLMANWIVTMTLKTKNILYRRDSETVGKLVIVDNVGNSDFIPLTNYSPVLARLKIARKWRRFEQTMLDQYPGRRVLESMPPG